MNNDDDGDGDDDDTVRKTMTALQLACRIYSCVKIVSTGGASEWHLLPQCRAKEGK